jgi:hypothetical protein
MGDAAQSVIGQSGRLCWGAQTQAQCLADLTRRLLRPLPSPILWFDPRRASKPHKIDSPANAGLFSLRLLGTGQPGTAMGGQMPGGCRASGTAPHDVRCRPAARQLFTGSAATPCPRAFPTCLPSAGFSGGRAGPEISVGVREQHLLTALTWADCTVIARTMTHCHLPASLAGCGLFHA